MSDELDNALIGQLISEIAPLPSDPMMRRVRVGRKTVATLRVADVESLAIEVGTKWSATLARKTADAVEMHKARRTAFALLGRRPYSRAELIQRLTKKGHTQKLAANIADELAADRWIDDEAYGKALAEHMKRRSLTSPEIVQARLHSKRIDPGLAAKITRESLHDVNQIDAAMSLIRRRLGNMSTLPPHKIRNRIGSLLARRGFDEDVIGRVLEKLNVPLLPEDD